MKHNANAADCPICGARPEFWWNHTISCPDCYDGAPDAGPQIVGYGFGRHTRAVDDWNEQVEEYLAEQEDREFRERR